MTESFPPDAAGAATTEATLREQLQADPSLHAAALSLARLLLGDGRDDQAISLLSGHETDRECGDLLREYFVGERRNSEARRLIDRRGGQASASGLVDRAIAAQMAGDLETAVTSCKLAIATDARYAPAHNHLGRALFNQRGAEPARAAFIQAVRIAPDYAEAWHNLAHVLRDAREFEQAEHAYGHALRLRPGYRSALLNRGIVRTALLRHELALADFRSVLAIDPNHAEACLNIAQCQHLLRRDDAARAAYEHAIALDPRNPRAYLQYGRMLGETFDDDGALRQFRAALDLNPRDPEIWGEIAMAHERAHRLDEVERAVVAGLAVAPNDPGLHLERANLSRHGGDHATALTRLRAIPPQSLPPHLRARHQQLLELTLAKSAETS